ncbi:MAG: amidohydrolase family protein, partial [Chloroflexi bacterium]|nr:amidohydrolase family protein [Chloroflexota bacterium]
FIGDLMDTFPNIYYTVDALLGDGYFLHPEETPAGMLAQTEDYPPMLAYDLDFWKEIIEAHPDRFMWGTDRGGIVVWGWDVEIGRRMVDYARAFIGQLDPAVQEKFAYQNAERLIQTGK